MWLGHPIVEFRAGAPFHTRLFHWRIHPGHKSPQILCNLVPLRVHPAAAARHIMQWGNCLFSHLEKQIWETGPHPRMLLYMWVINQSAVQLSSWRPWKLSHLKPLDGRRHCRHTIGHLGIKKFWCLFISKRCQTRLCSDRPTKQPTLLG